MYNIFISVPAIYSKPAVMVTDDKGLEIINNVLMPNKQYNISVRDEPWDEKNEILHMTYHTFTNSWRKSAIKLNKSFQRKIVDHESLSPTLVSVIQVVKEVNNIKISYSSSLFTLSHYDDMGKLCQNWIQRDKQRTRNLDNLFPCPCTLSEAEIDCNYQYDVGCTLQETHPFWQSHNCKTKKGAYVCMISKSMM